MEIAPARGILILPTLAIAMSGLAALSVMFTRFNGGVAFIWPVASLLLAYLVREKVRRWPQYLLVGAAGLIAQGLITGPAWQMVVLMEVIRVIEPLIAAFILCPMLEVGVNTQTVRGMAWFIAVAGLLAPTLAGMPAAWVVSRTTNTDYMTSLVSWVAAHGLGAVLFTPIFSAMATSGWHLAILQKIGRAALKAVPPLILMGLISSLVFSQSTMPLLFLPLLPMAYVTMYGGWAGATLSVMVLAVVSVVHTAQGHGPLYLMHVSVGTRWLFLQAYVACTALLVLPISALLSERARLIAGSRESEARYRSIAESLGDAVTDVGPDGLIRYASPSISEIAGVDADALIGTPARELVCHEDREVVIVAYLAAQEQPGTATVVQYRGPVDHDGNQSWFEASMRPLYRNGCLDGVLSSVRDITNRKSTEIALAREANLDPLTGLLNRRAFMRELEKRCDQVLAGEGRGDVVLLDLDHFKAINDRLGHAAGDAVLKDVADAMGKLAHGEDMVARIGGEEFAFLLWGAEHNSAVVAADRLRVAVSDLTFASDQGPFCVTASLGLATLQRGVSAVDALKAADVALYKAKTAGRNCLRIAI